MANFWGGFGQGFSGGFKRSWDASARRRERKEDREYAEKLAKKAQELKDQQMLATLRSLPPEDVEEAMMRIGGAPMVNQPTLEELRGTPLPSWGDSSVDQGVSDYRSLDPKDLKGLDIHAAAAAGQRIEKERAAEKTAIRTIELGSAAERFAEAGKAGVPFSKVYSPTSPIPEPLQKSLHNFGVNERTVGNLEAKRKFGVENFKHFNGASKGLTGWFGDFVPSPEVMQTIPGAMIAGKEIDLATQRKSAWDIQNEIDNKEGQFSRDEIIGMEPSALSVYIGDLNRKKREESSTREVEAARQKAAATEAGRMSVQPTEDEALAARIKQEKALVRINLGLPVDASDKDVSEAKASDTKLPYKFNIISDQFGVTKQIVVTPTGHGEITDEMKERAKNQLLAVDGLMVTFGKDFKSQLGIDGDKDKSKSDTVTPEKQETPMERSDSSLVTPFSDMDKSTAERSRSLKIGEQVQVGEESYERVPEGLKLIKEAPPLPLEPIPPLPLEPIPPLPSGEPLPPPTVDPLPPSPTSNREILELDKSLIIARREYAELYKKMMASPIKKMAGTGEYKKAQALQKEILDLEAKIRGLKSNR